MSLLENMQEACVRMVHTKEPDGEGGRIAGWKDGVPIIAAIVFDASTQARVAEKQGAISRYTVTVSGGETLKYHDVIKRISDGKVFRMTSDGTDMKTPACASFQFAQATAEEWQPT